MDGDVTGGRVALVDARINDVARLRLEDCHRHLCTSNDTDSFKELHLSTQGAEMMVFYCNHANSNSPSRAHGYLSWLKSQPLPAGQSQHQRVMVLEGGMGALVRHAQSTLDEEKLMHVFIKIWDE